MKICNISLWILILTFAINANAQTDTLDSGKHFILRFSIGVNYQNNNFIHTDFSGSNVFIYENKVRYSASTCVEYNFSERYFFSAGIRIQDVGWKRIDTVNYIESHPDYSKFSFLYLSPTIGIGRRIYQGNKFSLNASLGVDPEFRIYKSQTIFFSDNTVTKTLTPSIGTIKFNTLFWLSITNDFYVGESFSIGINYLCGINHQSFNKKIIPNNPIVHSLGLTFGLK